MLKPKQKKCAELLASGQYTQKEIAKQINVAEKTISTWKKNDEFAAECDAILRMGIKSMAARAFKTELSLLEASSEAVRLAAAKDIFDRAGFKPDDNINLKGAGMVVIVDDCNQ